MKYKSLDSIIDDIAREKNKLISALLDQYSLGNGQFQILNEVGWHEGISQEGVAAIRRIDKSAVAKSVKGLIDKGYVYKEVNKDDKRAYCLYCTEKGKEMIPKIKDIITNVDQILVNGFSDSEILLIRKLCLKISSNLENFSIDEF